MDDHMNSKVDSRPALDMYDVHDRIGVCCLSMLPAAMVIAYPMTFAFPELAGISVGMVLMLAGVTLPVMLAGTVLLWAILAFFSLRGSAG